jgi:membrane-associated protease RseP (regulator of RpoE activity)
MRLTHTPLAIALFLLAGGAHADPETKAAPPDKAALQAQLKSAQADLDRAAGRVAELTTQLGLGDGVRVQRIHASRPVLGLVLAPFDGGVRIAGVTPDSPAANAGVLAGDVLTAIDGHPILGSSRDLRVTNARGLLDHLDVKIPVSLAVQRSNKTLTFKVTPVRFVGRPAFAFVDSSGDVTAAMGDVLLDGDPDNPGISARAFYIAPPPPPPGVSPQIRREVIRMGPGEMCKGKDCDDLPLLAEAFRWHGLNLAAVDAQLGRYFGTNSGVLVLSTGQALAGLQPGDVLRTIDGKPVATPRQAMAALEARPVGTRVDVEYLRDKRAAHAQVTVPKAMPWRFPAPPPPPPAPPVPRAPAAPRAPMAPPAPPPPPGRRIVVIEGNAPLLAMAPAEAVSPMPPMPPDDATPEN